MSLLARYIVKSHTYLFLMTLAVGIGIFILIDLIERVDVFLANDDGAKFIIPYYIARLPGIVSQILPAVFLLSTVIMLCVMLAAREVVALQAGGISMLVITKLLMFCGIFWAIVQFLCAQLLMSYGEKTAEDIWAYDVRQLIVFEKSLDNVWFTENNYIVYVNKLYESGKGNGLIAYELSENSKKIQTIIRAENTSIDNNGQWHLENVQITKPDSYETNHPVRFVLPIEQSINFFFIGEQEKPQYLGFFTLWQAIDRLDAAGSNVEGLTTVLYGKISYALAIIIFAFVAVAIITYKENIYLAVTLAVVMAFLSYALTVFGDSLGQAGSVPPIVGAFAPQIILLTLALTRIRHVVTHR